MVTVGDVLDFTGTLFVPVFNWFWMLVCLGLGAWVGWRTAGEATPEAGKSRSEEGA